jgi:cytochrome c oxidase subunit 3
MSDPHAKPGHQYHLVNPSPWPFVAAMSALALTFGAARAFHHLAGGVPLAAAGLLGILYVMAVWWRDIVREAQVDHAHTAPVSRGLRLGMALFITSEVMFFVAFFWAFFGASTLPRLPLDDVWNIAPGVWPPKGIHPFDPWSIPFLNTLILLLSGTTVTWAHHAALENQRKQLVQALTCTVILGLIFTSLQAYEYTHAAFGFTQGVYASTFYMATGFHGFHVIVGTIFLMVCLFRARRGDFTPTQHLGLEFAAWYWHFVDVVWLFLFVCVYGGLVNKVLGGVGLL